MRKKKEIIAIVPARGNSKSVPYKNIRPLADKPLIYYTIKEAELSKYISRIIISTDSPKIAKIGKSFGAEVPFLRPQKLAEDGVQDLPVFQHALRFLEEKEKYLPEVVVHLRPTAPLRRAAHIDKGIETLLASPGADSVRSVCLAPKHPFKAWKIEKDRLLPFISQEVSGIKEAYNFPRQMLPGAYIQNGSVDVIWTKTILEKNSMSGDYIKPLVMDEMDSINIDTFLDFELAEILMKRRIKK